MHIVGLIAENYKRLRVVEITPKGHVVQITGKNAQGKTSVLDAIWTALKGASAMPEKPVRKGAERARIKVNIGELVVTRTINASGTHTLTVENSKGVRVASPQTVLDELLGALTFDPLAFVGMKAKQQVEMLRQVVKVEIDIDAINAANKADYEQRTFANREVSRLETEVASITVQADLPAEKLDEKTILDQLNSAGEANQKAREQFIAKQNLLKQVGLAQESRAQNQRAITHCLDRIAELEQQLAAEREALALQERALETHEQRITEAQEAYNAAPEGTAVDVAALTQELQHVQLVNRELDKVARKQDLQKKLDAKRREADQYTRSIEDREEQKRAAIQNAAMPVPGLTFDENEVMYNGIPIVQLGEAEQIRISTAIAMAANPKLRILRIMHGEGLDDDSLKILADMAAEHDFQIWMAKVDSSGKVGIVMEDGMVKTTED